MLMRRMLIIVLVCIAAFTIVACENSAGDADNVEQWDTAGEIVDYGHGVYYFPYREHDFANALSAFISAHRGLELLAISGNGNSAYGKDAGYFVVFRRLN